MKVCACACMNMRVKCIHYVSAYVKVCVCVCLCMSERVKRVCVCIRCARSDTRIHSTSLSAAARLPRTGGHDSASHGRGFPPRWQPRSAPLSKHIRLTLGTAGQPPRLATALSAVNTRRYANPLKHNRPIKNQWHRLDISGSQEEQQAFISVTRCVSKWTP